MSPQPVAAARRCLPSPLLAADCHRRISLIVLFTFFLTFAIFCLFFTCCIFIFSCKMSTTTPTYDPPLPSNTHEVSKDAAKLPFYSISDLSTRIDKLARLISSLENAERNQSRSSFATSEAKDKRPSPSRSSTRTGKKICWYHRAFQDRAKKCRPPCHWKPENRQGCQ